MADRDSGYTFKRWLEALVQWALHFIFTLTRSSRYLIITPPGLSHQIVLDTGNRRLIHFRRATFYDVGTLMEVFIRREYLPNKPAFERAVDAHYSRILEQGKTPMILDLGANVGASSAILAIHFPLASVLSVEPDNQNFEKLNSVAAQFANITPVNAAVSSTNGTISLFEGEIHGNNAFRTFGGNPEKLLGTVPALDPKSLITLGAPNVPFIVKIDIEGYEAELFDTNTDWLDEFPIVMAEPHDWMIEGTANSRSMMTSILNVKRDLFLSGENILACSIRSR